MLNFLKYFRTVDVYYVYYRSRRPGDGDTDWEEQIVETVNNTINHMVGVLMQIKSNIVIMINHMGAILMMLVMTLVMGKLSDTDVKLALLTLTVSASSSTE